MVLISSYVFTLITETVNELNTCSKVDLPDPLAPVIASVEQLSTEIETFLKIQSLLYRLPILLASIFTSRQYLS